MTWPAAGARDTIRFSGFSQMHGGNEPLCKSQIRLKISMTMERACVLLFNITSSVE